MPFYAMQFFPCSCFHAVTFLSSKYVYLKIGLSFTNITVGKLVKAPMQEDQKEDHRGPKGRSGFEEGR